eukprot:3637790-Rhodomonas_salina.1
MGQYRQECAQYEKSAGSTKRVRAFVRKTSTARSRTGIAPVSAATPFQDKVGETCALLHLIPP